MNTFGKHLIHCNQCTMTFQIGQRCQAESVRCPDCKRRFSHGEKINRNEVLCSISPEDFAEWDAKDNHTHIFGRYLGCFMRGDVEWCRAGCNTCSRITEFPSYSKDRKALLKEMEAA